MGQKTGMLKLRGRVACKGIYMSDSHHASQQPFDMRPRFCLAPPGASTAWHSQGARAHMLKKVMTKAIMKAFVSPYQNLNSGSLRCRKPALQSERMHSRPRQAVQSSMHIHLRTKGRNSSSLEVGSVGPSVSGSDAGDRKPISRFSA
jgi:hypothetical protein